MAAVLIAYMLVLMAAAVGGLLITWGRIRHLRYRSVVQTLAMIVGQNLPLTEGLRAAAKGEQKALRQVYERMARRLEAGDSLSTALRSALLSCPGHIAGALQGAEQGGTLPSVLRSLAADTRRGPTLSGAALAPTMHSLVLLVILPFALLFILVVAVPRFKDIFADFDIELPRMTAKLFALGSSPVLAIVGVVPLLLILALAGSHITIARNFLVRMPDSLQWPSAILDGLAWWLPLLCRVAETRALARQLPLMHAALRAGHDLPAAARQAACVDTNYHARRRLLRWATRLEAGEEPATAARRLGFPRPLLRVLAAAGGGADLAAALEYLASYYRSLTVHWQHVLLSAVMPLVVLMWGLCVGYVVVAVFLPLIALLESVLATIY